MKLKNADAGKPCQIILCEPDSFGGRSEPLKPVVTRDSPRDSLGLLSPLRCSASCAATLIHRICSHKIIWQGFPAVYLQDCKLCQTCKRSFSIPQVRALRSTICIQNSKVGILSVIPTYTNFLLLKLPVLTFCSVMMSNISQIRFLCSSHPKRNILICMS